VRELSVNHAPRLGVTALLTDVIGADGAELQQVNTDAFLPVDRLRAVCVALPRLQVLNAQFRGECAALLPILRNDPPYGPIRVSVLGVWSEGDSDADVLALAAAVASHESLKGLTLTDVHFEHGLNALVDAAAERRISQFTLEALCVMDTGSVAALTRLLQRGSMTKLRVNCVFPDAEESSMELCAALRSCRALTDLRLCLNPPHGASRRVITELLDAVAALPALSALDLYCSDAQDKAATGRALGALLAANLPSLRSLSVFGCQLRDEGMGPLLDGLAANTHLRKLGSTAYNSLSEEFERDRLEPALAVLAARAALDA
jgi:hypothetical protein